MIELELTTYTTTFDNDLNALIGQITTCTHSVEKIISGRLSSNGVRVTRQRIRDSIQVSINH